MAGSAIKEGGVMGGNSENIPNQGYGIDQWRQRMQSMPQAPPPDPAASAQNMGHYRGGDWVSRMMQAQRERAAPPPRPSPPVAGPGFGTGHPGAGKSAYLGEIARRLPPGFGTDQPQAGKRPPTAQPPPTAPPQFAQLPAGPPGGGLQPGGAGTQPVPGYGSHLTAALRR